MRPGRKRARANSEAEHPARGREGGGRGPATCLRQASGRESGLFVSLSEEAGWVPQAPSGATALEDVAKGIDHGAAAGPQGRDLAFSRPTCASVLPLGAARGAARGRGAEPPAPG